MHLLPRVAFGALLSTALCAHAGQPSRTTDPADPAATVPAIDYQSALAGYTPAPKDAPAPDKAWRAANATVAGQPGHAGHHAPAPAAEREAAPAKPAPASPATAPARGHEKHHQHH